MGKMNGEQEKIWDYLSENALGKANSISIHKIRRDLDLDDKDVTCYSIRMLIRGMITECGCCIGSGTTGFWIIKDEQVLNEVLSNLTDRINGILQRAESLQANWEIAK